MIESAGDWQIRVNSGPAGRKCWLKSGDVIHLTDTGPDLTFEVTTSTASSPPTAASALPPGEIMRKPGDEEIPPPIPNCATVGQEAPPPLPNSSATRRGESPSPSPTGSPRSSAGVMSVGDEEDPPPVRVAAATLTGPVLPDPPALPRPKPTSGGSKWGSATDKNHPVSKTIGAVVSLLLLLFFCARMYVRLTGTGNRSQHGAHSTISDLGLERFCGSIVGRYSTSPRSRKTRRNG